MAIDVFFDKLHAMMPSASVGAIGYREGELRKIERLYDISIAGDFAQFMLRAGRCDGGALGDDPIILYRPAWNVRTQILFQVNFFTSLQEIGAFYFLKKPFVFSREAETQYYFLQTSRVGDESVYHYDENNEQVRNTGKTFAEYLTDLLDYYPLGGVVCKGDLLDI